MSNYRRLISYIYAYEGGIKRKNVGFAKLEMRNGQCKIQVNVRNVYIGSQDTGVYLLSGSTEILIGKIFIRNGAGEFRTVVSVANVAGSNQSIEQCYGLTVHNLSDSWQSYTTIWEDAVAHAAEVVLGEATSESIQKNEKQSVQEKERPSSIAEAVEVEIEAQSRQQEQKNQKNLKQEVFQTEEPLPSSVIPSLEPIPSQILRPSDMEAMELKPMEVTPIAGQTTAETLNINHMNSEVHAGRDTENDIEKSVFESISSEEDNSKQKETTKTNNQSSDEISDNIETTEHIPKEQQIPEKEQVDLTINDSNKTVEDIMSDQTTADSELKQSDFLNLQSFPAGTSLEQLTSLVPVQEEPSILELNPPPIPPVIHPLSDFSKRTEQQGEWGQQPRSQQSQISQQSRQGQQNWWFPAGRMFQSSRPSYSNRQSHLMQRGQPTPQPIGQGRIQEPEHSGRNLPQNQSEPPIGQFQPGQLTRPARSLRPSRLFPPTNPNIQQQNVPGPASQIPTGQTKLPNSRPQNSNLSRQPIQPNYHHGQIQPPGMMPSMQQGQRGSQIPSDRYRVQPNPPGNQDNRRMQNASNNQRNGQIQNPSGRQENRQVSQIPNLSNNQKDSQKDKEQRNSSELQTDKRLQETSEHQVDKRLQEISEAQEDKGARETLENQTDMRLKENSDSQADRTKQNLSESPNGEAEQTSLDGQKDKEQNNLSESQTDKKLQEISYAQTDKTEQNQRNYLSPSRTLSGNRLQHPGNSANHNMNLNQTYAPTNTGESSQTAAADSLTISADTSKAAGTNNSQAGSNGTSQPTTNDMVQSGTRTAVQTSQAELEAQQREQLKQLEQANLEEEPKIDMIWEHFYKSYPKIQAFDYNGGCEILTIKPQDIGLLPRETWGYGNNSFLLHGYYNHRYLIFARLNNPKGEPRFLLGVPGHYYSNEKYMAAMFGFPNFVLSKVQPAGDGRFGYWYTDVRLGS